MIRLVGAMIAEQTDEWAIAKPYLGAETLKAPHEPNHARRRSDKGISADRTASAHICSER